MSDLRSANHSRFPDANLDLHLTPTQKSQRAAWIAHAESKLGNLVVKHYVESQCHGAELFVGPQLVF